MSAFKDAVFPIYEDLLSEGFPETVETWEKAEQICINRCFEAADRARDEWRERHE